MPNDAPMPPVVEPTKTLVSARTARRRRALTVAGGVLALFALWELATGFVAYTSDAYVRSDLISVAPEVTGRIVAVVVHDNQPVAAGDLLAKIDPEPFRLARDAAQASLREAAAHIVADQDAAHIADAQRQVADAALTYAQETIRRVQALQADSVASRAQLDDANAALRRATADVAAASGAQAKAQQLLAADAATQQRLEAELALAEWRLDRTRIVAPGDGTINNLTLRVGDMARAAEPLIGGSMRTPGASTPTTSSTSSRASPPAEPHGCGWTAIHGACTAAGSTASAAASAAHRTRRACCPMSRPPPTGSVCSGGSR